jgi:hypothetical protein
MIEKAAEWFTRVGQRNLALAVIGLLTIGYGYERARVEYMTKERREDETQRRIELKDCEERTRREVTQLFQERVSEQQAQLEHLYGKLNTLEQTAHKLRKR